MGLMKTLVKRRRHRWARELMLLDGLDVPAEVQIGDGLVLQHRGLGTVIHPETIIGRSVTIYHQVTIGRADAHVARESSPMEQIVICDQAIIHPSAKVLGGAGVTSIGVGTILAADAVLTMSTGDWGVLGGVPARKLADRRRDAT